MTEPGRKQAHMRRQRGGKTDDGLDEARAALRRIRRRARLWGYVATAIGSVLSVGLFVAAVIFAVVGWKQRAMEQPIAHGVTTTGTVVRVDVHSSYRSPTVYRAVIEYHDSLGLAHTFSGPSSTSRSETGDTVTVSYSPTHPDRAHDLSIRGWSWQLPFASAALLAALALSFAVAFVRAFRIPNRRPHRLKGTRSRGAPRPRRNRKNDQ
jgi:hypothetical protein